MWEIGKFPGVEEMVTSRIELDDVAKQGFEELVRNKDHHIKILVTPKSELLSAQSQRNGASKPSLLSMYLTANNSRASASGRPDENVTLDRGRLKRGSCL